MADTAQAVTQDEWNYAPPKVPAAVKPPTASAPATPSNQDEWDYGPAKASTPKAAVPSAQARWAEYAKPGPYVTQLDPQDETRFQSWVKQNQIPWQDSPTSDYDMRGFWKAQQSGDPNAKRGANLHFPDTWKTPYHETFSNESKYALPTAGRWAGPNRDVFQAPETSPIGAPATDEWEYHSPAHASLPGATPRLAAMVDAGKVPGAQTEPTQIEKNTPPEPTWGSAAKNTAKNLISGMVKFTQRVLTPTPNNPDRLTETAEDVARELPEAQERISTQQADVAAEKQAMEQRRAEGYNPIYRVLAPFVDETGVVPINARQMEEQSRRGQFRQIATDATGGALLTASPMLTKGAIKAGSYGWQQVGRPMMDAFTDTAGELVPEGVKDTLENTGIKSPAPAKALTRGIQPGVNIPRAAESIQIAGPRLQNVAQKLGEEIKEPGDLTPGAKVTSAAKQQIWDALEQRIGQVDDFMSDTNAIADRMKAAIPDRIREQYPELAERLDKRAETYLGQKSLRQIENAIESANNDLRGLYARPNITDAPISADAAVTKAEVEGARELLDQRVRDLTGNEDVPALKREYGAIRDVERAAARANVVYARQKGMPLYHGLAALSAAGDLVSGNLLGAAKGAFKIGVGRYLQRLRDPGYLVDQAFQGRGAFEPAPDIPSAKPLVRTPIEGAPVNLAAERELGGAPPARPLLTEGRTLITPAPADRSGPISLDERIPMPGWATPADERPLATPTQQSTEPRPVARPLSKLPSGVREIPPAKPLSRAKPLGLSQAEIRQSVSDIQRMSQDKLDYLTETKDSQRAPQQIREAAQKRWEELTGQRAAKAAPVAQQYPKDAVEYAESQMRGALDLSDSIGRPGRYHVDLGEGAPAREQDKAWYGIPAQKENIAGQFPWFNDSEISASRVANALKKGPGSADYEYIVGKILASEKK